MKPDSFDMTNKLLTATTPPKIVAIMTDIETHLRSHTAEQNRYFFSSNFPTLLNRVFGFENFFTYRGEKPPSWFDWASFDQDLTRKIFAFLSPSGTLISSILAVDRLSALKYAFPVDCLPEWIMPALHGVQDSSIFDPMCPLLKGRVKGTEFDFFDFTFEFHLNVFEYFFFWFAYYAFIRGNCRNFGIEKINGSSKDDFKNWYSSSIVRIRILEQQNDYGLYLSLFNEYLHAFVPTAGFNDSVAMRAEFVVNVFVHYWLLEADVSPLPVYKCMSAGVPFPIRVHVMRIPPALGLGEMVKLFVKHVNLSLVLVTRVSKKPHSRGTASWNACIQRPLYRFILRNFLFWPTDKSSMSMKNICDIFLVWIDYIEPWKLCEAECSDTVRLSQLQYSLIWEGYVLSNYLFYTSMVMHFIGFANKFLGTHAELVVPMVTKVIDILTSSRELMDLIKNVDAAFHSTSSESGYSAVTILCKFVPQIHEQLQDWEFALGKAGDNGNQKKDLRLFRAGADGGPQLLEHFILQAERDNLSKNLQYVHTLKSQFHSLFGVHVSSQPPQSPQSPQSPCAIRWFQSCVELFKTSIVSSFKPLIE